MEDDDYPIDYKIVGHLLFITLIYILTSFWLFDLCIPEHRSIASSVLFFTAFGYTLANSRLHLNLLSQTNYELPTHFAVSLFGIWVAFTNLTFQNPPSIIAGIILLFSALSVLQCGYYWLSHVREQATTSQYQFLYMVPSILVSFCLILVSLSLFTLGNWEWPFMSLFDALEELMAESSRKVQPLF